MLEALLTSFKIYVEMRLFSCWGFYFAKLTLHFLQIQKKQKVMSGTFFTVVKKHYKYFSWAINSLFGYEYVNFFIGTSEFLQY